MSESPVYHCRLTSSAAQQLRVHLLSDRTREQLAVCLCGLAVADDTITLPVREVACYAPEAFALQDSGALVTRADAERAIHARARRLGLVQMDWHTHPGRGPVSFSDTDTARERELAQYIARKADGAPYASVVINDDCAAARIWVAASPDRLPEPHELSSLLTTDLLELLAPLASPPPDAAHARQVLAFGAGLQARLASLMLGIVGVGGLGSQLLAHLARLGTQRFVLADPDTVETSNLNRLAWATRRDAQQARPKVDVAQEAILALSPDAAVQALQAPAESPMSLQALKSCDLLIVATDNHNSRIAMNRLSARYLIPLLHVGFHLAADEAAVPRAVTDISGEVVIPEVGEWCLECAGLVQPVATAIERLPNRAALEADGYLAGTPQAAVGHLDGVVAALAAAQIHNLVYPYAPLKRYLAYDGLRATIDSIGVSPSEGCPVCSPDSGLLALGDRTL